MNNLLSKLTGGVTSFFSSLSLTHILAVSTGTLLASTILLGYLLKHSYEAQGASKQVTAQLTQDVKSSQKETQLVTQSCTVTDQVITQADQGKQNINDIESQDLQSLTKLSTKLTSKATPVVSVPVTTLQPEQPETSSDSTQKFMSQHLPVDVDSLLHSHFNKVSTSFAPSESSSGL